MNYTDKLKDPRWQKKRLEILERDGWMCKACGETEKTLHVHHIFYFSGRDPWDIENGFLITFCEGCHKSLPCCEDYQSCDDCPDFNFSCDGPGNHPKDIQTAIAVLLNHVWETDRQGDYFTALGVAHSRI